MTRRCTSGRDQDPVYLPFEGTNFAPVLTTKRDITTWRIRLQPQERSRSTYLPTRCRGRFSKFRERQKPETPRRHGPSAIGMRNIGQAMTDYILAHEGLTNSGVTQGFLASWNPPLPVTGARRPFQTQTPGWSDLVWKPKGYLTYSYSVFGSFERPSPIS